MTAATVADPLADLDGELAELLGESWQVAVHGAPDAPRRTVPPPPFRVTVRWTWEELSVPGPFKLHMLELWHNGRYRRPLGWRPASGWTRPELRPGDSLCVDLRVVDP